MTNYPKSYYANRLRLEYTDIFGRTTLHPSKSSDPLNTRYDSENQHLWSGEALVLLKLNNLLTRDDLYNFTRGVYATQVMPGLYNRQHKEDPSTMHPISHDEMTGIVVGSIAGNIDTFPKDILNYGKNHNWIFANEAPGAKLSSGLFKYFSRIRQPKDVGVYKAGAGVSPNLVEKFSILVASYLSSRKPAPVTSGKVMWFYKFQALKLLGLDKESVIIKLAINLFKKNMVKVYGGEDWAETIHEIYFHADHPFRGLVRGITL